MIVKQMVDINGSSINQNKSNYQTVFSARFDKQDEGDQSLGAIGL